MTRKRNRYREKQKGAPKKPQMNRTCKRCLCRHCICQADFSQHFRPTLDEIERWHGDDAW